MKKFEFSTEPTVARVPPTIFSGRTFYNIYKESAFLRDPENVETILSRNYQLRNMLKQVEPGETIMVGKMELKKGVPLLVKNTSSPNVIVEDYEFTNNRLTGLVAAYAFDHRHSFSNINSSEAQILGLTWDGSDKEKCKLYLSAVTGTEHFYDQFSFWPLICALRKFQLRKITPELVVKMAKIKNNDGERLSKEFRGNMETVLRLWKQFPGATGKELSDLISNAPLSIVEALKSK